MAATLGPAFSYTAAMTTPLAAAAKPFPHPEFSRESRAPKCSSSPALDFGQQQQKWSPPDEEKGRSMRSPGSRSTSTASLQLGDLSLESEGSTTDVETMLGDDALFEDWYQDRKAGEGRDSLTGDDDPFNPAVKVMPWLETERMPSRMDWSHQLADTIMNTKEDLDLSARELYEVPDSIWELSTMRKFVDPRITSADPRITSVPFTSKRSFARTQSESVLGHGASKVKARAFKRTPSGPLYASSEAIPSAVPLIINLSNNHLTASSISHALFTLSNLKVLFLRQNELQRLPEGIGRLSGLVELSLSSNQLEYLPAEIQHLPNLAELRLHPNPFHPPPPTSDDKGSAYRTLGDLVVHFRIPSLAETCTRFLLSSDPTSASYRLRILSYELPSTLAEHLRRPFRTTLSPPSASSSSAFSGALSRRHRERTTSTESSFLSSSTSSRGSASTAVDYDDEPFDPLANICRSPAHPDEERPFHRHAVERLEWVSEACLTPGKMASGRQGARTIPIRHRGCGIRCLDWLEEPISAHEQ